MSKPNEYDTYIIPPNFIEGGTFFGGLLKLRNTAEALVIVLAIGMPVFSVSALTLTAKIIILCLTALPLGIIALVGINGESLSSFIFLVLKYLCNRRVITRNEEEQDKREKRRKRKAKSGDDAPKYINPVAEYLPVEKIENGIIYTRDHRYLKIVEVIPINFLLRSAREQRNIIYSFISFLKISPVKMQIKVIAKRADLNRHREIVQQEMAQETDENCRLLQQDYLTLIDRIGAREATTRRFFMVFEYEAWAGRKRGNEEEDAIASLQTVARTAVNYLKQCGNEVLIPENDDEFTVDTLYHLLCRNGTMSLPDRVRQIIAQYKEKGLESEIDAIPCTEFFAPDSIDFTNGRHICIDGLYYSYLLVPSTGYKAQVPAGWLSLIVNAGDGIDLDMFISRQPKARMVQRLGQQLRINRSKIKDASDTNTDFDDLDGAIRSGYFLKEGLGNNEDFYYLNLLITVTAPTVDELEWKVNEMKKLLMSRDMDVCSCAFHEEQAFLSSLPLVSMEKHLYERSKRNALTTGVASCYPFTSYELSDENGILFGLNKYNNSPVIIDIFDSKVYKNANIAVCGTSGAGKTFLILLMALRMRRKGIQVFMLAPLKGHEFHRACVNTGGEFISISPASKSCINVLEIRKVDKSVEEMLDGPGIERSELAAKIQRLHIFFALLIPDMSYEEKQLLDDALIRTYARKGITHDNTSLNDPDNPNVYREMPVLGDLYDVLKEESDTKRLSNIINRFVHGSASTFNQQTNVNLDNKFTVLDISELSGDLLPIGMFVALDFVWDKAKANRTEEKAIFIDECWQLIGGGSGTFGVGNRLAAEMVLEIRKIDKSVEETLDGPGIERSELAAKIQRLHIFFALLIPDMSYEEKQLLDDALIRTYARKGITHDNASLSDPNNPNVYRQMPVLGDLYDVLREESDTKRLSNIINRFVHGSASTFNQQTNVNLDNKFTVLDISELSGDLLPIGMFVALDFVWDKAKANRTEEKAIFIDECWQLIGGGSGTFGVGNRLAAEMVLEIFKTIRAYSGSGICATQDLNDFFSLDNGKYGKGIINNCRTKVILNLEDEEAQRVQQVLHLSEAEVMEITHFERGNGLISSNNNNITVEFKASPLERDLITTDRRELLDLLRRMKHPEA